MNLNPKVFSRIEEFSPDVPNANVFNVLGVYDAYDRVIGSDRTVILLTYFFFYFYFSESL